MDCRSNKITPQDYTIGIAGIACFDELPEGWRLATEADFYLRGELLVGVAYLMKNSSGQYEGYRTKAGSIRENISDVLNFVYLGRVFVLE